MPDLGFNRSTIRSEFAREVQASMDAFAVPLISKIVPSTVGSERYILGNTPDLPILQRGSATPTKTFSGLPWDIENGTYVSRMSVPLEAYERDQTGQTREIAANMGKRCAQLYAAKHDALIIAGESELSYNGQFLFDTAHTVGSSGAHSNLLTNTEVAALNVAGTAGYPTPEEAADILVGMASHMMTYKDDAGQPLHEEARKFVVLCHPKTFGSAITAVNANLLGGGDTPKTAALKADGFEFIVKPRPRFTDVTEIYLFRTDHSSMKALITQEEVKPRINFLGPDSEYALEHFHLLTTAYMRGETGVGEPLMCCKGTMS